MTGVSVGPGQATEVLCLLNMVDEEELKDEVTMHHTRLAENTKVAIFYPNTGCPTKHVRLGFWLF